jgi:hypothetical protein
MNKLALAALGLLTRAGKSLAALAGYERADAAAGGKKTKRARRRATPRGGSGKLH